MSLMTALFGTRNTRLLKHYAGVLADVNRYAAHHDLSNRTDDALKRMAQELKLLGREDMPSEELLPAAYALAREASKRVFGKPHYDVQILGGIALNDGKVAEMQTGEGKTLTAVLPAYLNALFGRGVQVVTANEYLAARDAAHLRPLYEFLGMTVACNVANMSVAEKQAAYAADITYTTASELGFDYLRDNTVGDAANKVQRPFSFAILDEVDAILIDDARTPLILSGLSNSDTGIYRLMVGVAHALERGSKDDPKDYLADEKTHHLMITDAGYGKAEAAVDRLGLLARPGYNLYHPENAHLLYFLEASVKALAFYKRDRDYVIVDGKVQIVDEHTGRVMPGRRWEGGIHQAIEALEGITVEQEAQVLAKVTFQHFFSMYPKLSGMTGTADTEAAELMEVYGLETVIIPTHKPRIRADHTDRIYRTRAAKFAAVVADIRERNKRGQPVLVGTGSVEDSEYLSGLLKRASIRHEVLNARNHAREAAIIAEAGSVGAVTIATNMAGRGTDILLGGNLEHRFQIIEAELAEVAEDDTARRLADITAQWEKDNARVKELGGLCVIGAERHESRRIDNQLRGRAGRQGDPGESVFYLSLEDKLVRLFGSQRLEAVLARMGVSEAEALSHPWISKMVARAQEKVENFNFEARKDVLSYDKVLDEQRELVYTMRNQVLTGRAPFRVEDAVSGLLSALWRQHMPQRGFALPEQAQSLAAAIERETGVNIDLADAFESLTEKELYEYTRDALFAALPKLLVEAARAILLDCIDNAWRTHLTHMDSLKKGIHLRSLAQLDPKQEYQAEAYQLFEAMLEVIGYDYAVINLKYAGQVQAPA